MGAALCSCGGHADEQGLNGLGFDRLASLKTGRVAAMAGRYGAFPPKHHHLQHPEHSSLLLSRGETYALSDDAHDESRGDERPASAQAYADALRAKLQEPPLSPRSKFDLLSSRFGLGGSLTDTAASSGGDGESGEEDSAARRRQLAWNSYSYPDEEEALDNSNEDESVTEEDWKQRANPLITIIVPPGPCGLVLQVDRADPGAAPTVDGFVRKYDGRKGTIENSGLVHKGSMLCAINDIDVSRMPLKEVIRTLNLSSHLERAFTFRNGFQHRNSM